MSKMKSTIEFVWDAKKIHGNRYCYSKVDYKGNKIPVAIVCPEHGEFFQKPNTHLRKNPVVGCRLCGIALASKKRSSNISDFVTKVKRLFPTYDYRGVLYINSKVKVKIKCKKHGVFYKTPNAILRKSGCPKCGVERTVNALKGSTTKFLVQARKVHGDTFDYSKAAYAGRHTKIKIVCKKHGEFFQTPGNHLRGAGCKKCAVALVGIYKRIPITELIHRFKQVHRAIYDYSRVVYYGADIPVLIGCKIHGYFKQRVFAHLNGAGCPICRQSKGERIVSQWLDDSGVSYIRNKRFKDCVDALPLSFDFYIPSLNACVEYDGEMHYKRYEGSFRGSYKLETTKKHDCIKTSYCKKKGINLIRIPYWRKNLISKILFRSLKVYSNETTRSMSQERSSHESLGHH